MMPRGPSATSSTACVSMIIVIVTSQRDARSAGEAAPAAPTAMSGAMASARRANTVTLCPRFNKLRAIGAPIAPSPITPTLAMTDSGSSQSKEQRAKGKESREQRAESREQRAKNGDQRGNSCYDAWQILLTEIEAHGFWAKRGGLLGQ